MVLGKRGEAENNGNSLSVERLIGDIRSTELRANVVEESPGSLIHAQSRRLDS